MAKAKASKRIRAMQCAHIPTARLWGHCGAAHFAYPALHPDGVFRAATGLVLPAAQNAHQGVLDFGKLPT